tara:strand:- start:58 stop:417 length:360 start_codon:yes stop_codon:yes gene_type:complete
MTKKEEKKEYDRKYYQANKEKRIVQSKVNYQANKEKILAQTKAAYESKKDGFYTVYLLVNENYVGQTHNLYTRLIAHKSRHGRDVSNVQILGKYKTREKAIKVESAYHSKGYLGYHYGL